MMIVKDLLADKPENRLLFCITNMMFKYVLIIVATFTLFSAANAEIKTGVITGKIVSAISYEPLPGANVYVVGTTLGAASDINGEFKIDKIPAGTYTLQVQLIGYEPNARNDINVEHVKPANIIIKLNESAIDVGSVMVYPDYFAQTPDFKLSTNVQSSEEVRRLPGSFEDIIRATTTLPGVAQAQPGRNDLMIRGGAPSENLFIIDNLEANNINHFGTQGAGGGPVSFVNLDYVEQTAFSTGGFGVRYGDKLSSVMNIDLQEGRTDRTGMQVTLSGTGFGFDIEGPVSDRGSYIVSARRSWLDVIFEASGFSFVPQYWDFMTKVDYSLDRSNKLSILALGAIDNVKYFNDTDDDRYDNSKVLGSDQNQAVTGVTWRHLFKKGYLNTSVGFNSVNFEFQQNDSLLQPIFINKSTESETYLKSELIYQLSKSLELTTGIKSTSIDFQSELLLPPFETDYGDSLAVDGNFKTMATKSSVYTQLSYNISKIRATFGGRLDYFDLIEDKYAFSPRLSATYDLSQRLAFKISAGRYYQSPSYIWLVANEQNRQLPFIAVDQHIAGWEYLLRSDTRVSLEGYYKRYFDYPASQSREYLVMSNTGSGFGGAEDGFSAFGLDPLVGEGKGQAYGLELLLQKKLSEIPCYGLVSASLSESKFTALDSIERPSNWDQRWIFNVGGGYIFNSRWEFAMRFRYASGRPYTPFNDDGTKSVESYNSERLQANHSLDLRLDRRWLFGRWLMITYIDIQNIYNRIPDDIPRWDERTGAIEDDDSIGILPSIGITVKF